MKKIGKCNDANDLILLCDVYAIKLTKVLNAINDLNVNINLFEPIFWY